MTLHNIIGLAATFVFAYGLTLCVFGGTFILTDLFMDWYLRFKQARKDRAAKVAAPPAKDGKDGK